MMVFLIMFIGMFGCLNATPEYALLSGNRCINCHVKAQGGGLRNDLGFYANEGMSLFQPAKGSLLGSVFNDMSNTALDGILTLGADVRIMSTRSATAPVTSSLPPRNTFPMQVSLMAALQPWSWMTAEAQVNAGKVKYSGQQKWSASAIIQPALDLPSVRVGFFQPSIGVNYDDHTMLVRQEADASPRPIIAPYYADWGAEVRYNAPLWLDVSAGVFKAGGLATVFTEDSVGRTRPMITSTGNMMVNARLCVSPKLFEEALNTYAGASILSCDDFTMINTFVGVGWQDRIGLLVESMMQGNRDAKQRRSVSGELFGRVADPLYLYARVENGNTRNVVSGEERTGYSQQYVLGAKVLLFPCVELRPEYRVIESDEFLRTRWVFQLHFYY